MSGDEEHEAVSEGEPTIEPDAGAESVPEAVAETELESEAVSDTEPEAIPEAESEAAPEAEAEIDLEPEEEAVPGDDDAEGPGLEKAGLPAPPDTDRLKSILESLIFVADKPVKERALAKAARATLAEIRPLLIELTSEYETRGISLDLVAGGYQFRSASRNAAFVRDMVAAKPVRMSRTQLETLSIVAYRQPVTRPEVDEIRGVDSGYALNALGERQLIKVVGRKEEPGRPLLYGTTQFFLEFFGLPGLNDLPTLREFSDLTDESRALFERKMGEPLDLASVEEAAQQAVEAAAAEMFDEDDEGEKDDSLGEGDDAETPERTEGSVPDDDDDDDDDERDPDDDGSDDEDEADDSDDEDDDSDDEADDSDDEDEDEDDE